MPEPEAAQQIELEPGDVITTGIPPLGTTAREALAGVRLLICMARADGILKPEELNILAEELRHLRLPPGCNPLTLMEEEHKPEDLAKEVVTQPARDCIYASVYAMACADREIAPAEEALLEHLRKSWDISTDDERQLAAVMKAGRVYENNPENDTDTVKPAEKIPVGPEFEKQFSRLRQRYCILTAATAAIPVPLIPDLIVIPMQVKLVHEIAGLYGLKAEKGTVQLLFETLGVGTGVRIGVGILCKMVPVWGSLVSASSAYATTYALASVAHKYYMDNCQSSLETLRAEFAELKKRGRAEFERDRDALKEARRLHGGQIEKLALAVHQGKLSPNDFEREMDRLG